MGHLIQQRNLWRKHLGGNIFGSIHVNASRTTLISEVKNQLLWRPNSRSPTISPTSLSKIISTAKPTPIAILNLDQPSVFCSADSGDIPGVYSTALLKSDEDDDGGGAYFDGGRKKSASSIRFRANKFTLKPVDWISLADSSASFQGKLYDFLEALDGDDFLSENEQSAAPAATTTTTRICPLKIQIPTSIEMEQTNNKTTMINRQSSSYNNVQFPSAFAQDVLSKNRREWTSTQLLQWRIRSLSIACNLAYTHSLAKSCNNICRETSATSSSSSTSTSPSQQQQQQQHLAVVPPSWRWVHELMLKEAGEVEGNVEVQRSDSDRSYLRRRLQQSYEALLLTNSSAGASSLITAPSASSSFFMLPRLDALVLAWKVVQKYGFCLCVETPVSSSSSSSSNLSLFPTLAPVVSSHLLNHRNEEQRRLQRVQDDDEEDKKTQKQGKIGWTGLKTTRRRQSPPPQKHEQQQQQYQAVSVRATSLRQELHRRQQHELEETKKEQGNHQQMVFVGSKYLSPYYSLPFSPYEKNGNKQSTTTTKTTTIGSSEKWFLVVETLQQRDENDSPRQLIWE